MEQLFDDLRTSYVAKLSKQWRQSWQFLTHKYGGIFLQVVNEE